MVVMVMVTMVMAMVMIVSCAAVGTRYGTPTRAR